MDNQDYGPIPVPPCEHNEFKIIFEYEDEEFGSILWCPKCGAWRWVYPNDPTGNEQPWHLTENEKT